MSGPGSRARQRRGAALPLMPARSSTLLASGQANACPGCLTASAGFGAAPQGASMDR